MSRVADHLEVKALAPDGLALANRYAADGSASAPPGFTFDRKEQPDTDQSRTPNHSDE